MLRLESLDTLARNEIALTGVAPDVALGAARFAEEGWVSGIGAFSSGLQAAAETELIFDLASVSKPFVATTFARMVARELVRPDTVLSDLVWESVGTPSAFATLEALLSHRAGLQAHKPLYAPLVACHSLDKRKMLAAAARSRRPDCVADIPAEGFPPVYSDLGYLLAGEALARTAELPLDQLVFREVCEPLAISAGSAQSWLCRRARFSARVAATEHVAFRGGVIRGRVHDENAWAFAGHRLAGQAGLFGTVEDVLRFGMALLDALAGREENWLSRRAVEHLVAPRPGGTLRLGFDAKSLTDSAAGASASLRTFGHLGFTGTSLWCDPGADIVTVLLTNRVCPSRLNSAIRRARPIVHEALFNLARSFGHAGHSR